MTKLEPCTRLYVDLEKIDVELGQKTNRIMKTNFKNWMGILKAKRKTRIGNNFNMVGLGLARLTNKKNL